MIRLRIAFVLLILWGACALPYACRPRCDSLNIQAADKDTLRFYDEVFAFVLPNPKDWELRPEAEDALKVRGDNFCAYQVNFRITDRGEPGHGPYEHNMHDYRHDSYAYEDPLTGQKDEVRFVRHICSSIGGWYGVFECEAFLEGDSVFVQCFVAKQEAQDRVMSMEIWGQFNTPLEKNEFKREAYRIIASTEWLSAVDQK